MEHRDGESGRGIKVHLCKFLGGESASINIWQTGTQNDRKGHEKLNHNKEKGWVE